MRLAPRTPKEIQMARADGIRANGSFGLLDGFVARARRQTGASTPI